jgi:hypothetical protein
MYLLYVDESGDTGLINSPSRYFGLTGLVVHELSWHQTLDVIIDVRRYLRATYGLKLREEIHAHHFLHSPGALQRIPKSMRLRLLRDLIDYEASIPDINIISVLVDKRGKSNTYNVFENDWRTLIQRFHNTISYRNFPGPSNAKDLGIIIADQTHLVPLMRLTRRLAKYNPIPNMGRPGYRQMPIPTICEDAIHRDSRHSYFIQLADVNSYFLVQQQQPCAYVSRKGARNYFKRLAPVLCLHASTTDKLLGIVRL